MSVQLAPVDPSVKKPAAITAQIERAEALLKQAAQPAQTPQETAPAPQAQETAPAPQEAPKPQETPTPTTPKDHPPADPDWERQFKAMKGRYDKDIGNATSTINALQQQLHSMQEQMRELQEARNAPQQVKYITPEDERDYGEEFLSVVERKAKELTAPMEAELVKLRAQVEGVNHSVAQTAQERMWAELDRRVPNWQMLNVNEEFVAWLNQPDIFAGQLRLNLIKQAYNANDAARVAAFFESFQKEASVVAPREARSEGRSDTAPAKPGLDQFVAPGRVSTSAPTPGPVEVPYITRKQISDFYTEVAAGKYRGREKEKADAERLIHAAQREGKILER